MDGRVLALDSRCMDFASALARLEERLENLEREDNEPRRELTTKAFEGPTSSQPILAIAVQRARVLLRSGLTAMR